LPNECRGQLVLDRTVRVDTRGDAFYERHEENVTAVTAPL